MSLREVPIALMGNGARECGWRHAPEARRWFWEIWKSQLVESRTRHRTRRVDFRGSLRRDKFARYGSRTRWGGGRWKSQNRKNAYHSPYVEEPFNSKVIKKFRSWTKKSCFLCFRIPTFYVYMLWTFYVRFTYPYHRYGTLVALDKVKWNKISYLCLTELLEI